MNKRIHKPMAKDRILEFEKVIAFLQQPNTSNFSIDADYICVKHKGGYVGDITAYIAVKFYKTPVDIILEGGRMAIYRVLNKHLGVDGQFIEQFADCDAVFDECLNLRSDEITLKDYAKTLEEYVVNGETLDWGWLIEEHREIPDDTPQNDENGDEE